MNIFSVKFWEENGDTIFALVVYCFSSYVVGICTTYAATELLFKMDMCFSEM